MYFLFWYDNKLRVHERWKNERWMIGNVVDQFTTLFYNYIYNIKRVGTWVHRNLFSIINQNKYN